MSNSVRFGGDSLMLADFVPARPKGRALDLGAGCGVIALALADLGKTAGCVAVELSEPACELARMGVRESGFEGRIEVVCADLRRYADSRKFDLVVCNPPYFAAGSGRISGKEAALAARHEKYCDIYDVAAAARRNLKQGGSLCLSFRPERLADALCALRESRLEPKRLRLARYSAGREPWLALLDARLDAGAGLRVLPDIVVKK
jgi:tRNA1(Val) A37 N6-methylase TrmN6